MKRVVFLFVLILSGVNTKAQKNSPIDSTALILKEWINIVSTDAFMEHISIRGISKELYTTNLKLLNLSLE